MDVANGEGIACSLFVQGCTHHCKNCFNPETWNFDGGKRWNEDIEDKFIRLCKQPQIDCVSILGGEPFDQGEDMYNLLKKISSSLYPVHKNIYLWTGYTIEQILSDKSLYWAKQCLPYIDYLIDGEYVDELRDLKLHLRGSSNQRIINLKEIMKEAKDNFMIEYDDNIHQVFLELIENKYERT